LHAQGPGSDRIPKVSVDREVFEFGMLDSQTPGNHDFVVSNVGKGILTITKVGSDCKCTKFDVEKSDLQPGQSTKVSMEWKATGGDGPFRHRGTIRTNDPERPSVDLTVTGQITTAIQPIPADGDFGTVNTGQPKTKTIRLLGYLPEGFRIEKHEFVDSKSAQFFDLKLEKMTAEQLAAENRGESALQPDAEKKPPATEPSAAEKKPAVTEPPAAEKNPPATEPPDAEKKPAVTEPPAAEKKPSAASANPPEKQVKCGYVAELTVKAGLPVGPFRQILRLTTNVKTVPTLSIPITGSVESKDLVVMGGGYRSGVLTIDMVSPENETTRTLTLIASGPHYKAINFQVLEVYPKDVLVVELGKPVELQSKAGTQTTLTIRIPKGSHQVDCLGTEQSPMGRVLLKTNHPSPEASTLLIRVKFAVAGS
jgi:hypothetical protein